MGVGTIKIFVKIFLIDCSRTLFLKLCYVLTCSGRNLMMFSYPGNGLLFCVLIYFGKDAL